MAKKIKRMGRWLCVLGPLALLVVLLARPGPAFATTYSISAMSLLSPNAECLCAYDCPACAYASVWSDPGPSWLTREMRLPINISLYPGTRRDLELGALYRSYFDGYSQFGYGIKPSWEIVVVKEIDDAGDPESAHGHHADVYYPSGVVSTFDWSGTAYAPQTCAETSTLSRPSGASGTYLLTDKMGNETAFNSAGFPNTFTDLAGNITTCSYNSSNQVTSIVDDRGQTYTFTQNSSGLVDTLEDPSGLTWTFSYNTDGCLTSIVTPATAQQTSGVTFSFGWDSSKRLTSVSDGRANTVKSIAVGFQNTPSA